MDFTKNFFHRFGATFFFGFTILAHGSVSDAQLQKQYGGKVLTFRRFYPGYQLHFDATGKLDNPPAQGAWTVDGQVQVRTISFKDRAIHIEGRRCGSSLTRIASRCVTWVYCRNTIPP